jgi:hypothetical protein
MITSLRTYFTRIVVGDCRDGVLFYSYHEESKKLHQIYCDPAQRLVADCFLMDANSVAVSDRKGSIAILSCKDHSDFGMKHLGTKHLPFLFCLVLNSNIAFIKQFSLQLEKCDLVIFLVLTILLGAINPGIRKYSYRG